MKLLVLILTALSQIGQQSIRQLDLESFLIDQMDLPAVCAGYKGELLDLQSLYYADLTGDGQEEVILNCSSCRTNHKQVDVHVVLSLYQGKLIRLPVGFGAGSNFKPFATFDGQSRVRYEFENGKLVSKQPSHNGKFATFTFQYEELEKGNLETGRFYVKNFTDPNWNERIPHPPSYVLPPAQSKRRAYLEKLIIQKEGLTKLCEGFSNPVLSLDRVLFADLTGDNREEAVITATTCAMGTGGPDVHKVFSRRGKQEIELPIVWPPEKFFANTRGRATLSVNSGKLLAELPLYKDEAECNACATGTRTFRFRYTRGRFTLYGEPLDKWED